MEDTILKDEDIGEEVCCGEVAEITELGPSNDIEANLIPEADCVNGVKRNRFRFRL
jgi:hypothetical protein